MTNDRGRNRVVIESVLPEIDGGRFPIKRVIGEPIVVQADVFGDGHDVVDCILLHWQEGSSAIHEVPMSPLFNDRWQGQFVVQQIGRHYYTLVAWIDRFQSWLHDLKKRASTDPDIEVNLKIGADFVHSAAKRAKGELASWLRSQAEWMTGTEPMDVRLQAAIDPELTQRMRPLSDRRFATRYDKELAVVVDRKKAQFSTWYELFPRSWSETPGKHGTFKDVVRQLPRISAMGFDVLYLPPIHPIGRTYRKGKNNQINATSDDVGSPWGIGASEGGHTAIHPALGSLEDFQHLVQCARKQGMEVALDIAYQCSPDHPWVTAHPEWFRRRPDGSIQYAENPPKKYQDIYPLDFESEDWQRLWQALADVVYYWINQGVLIFRVDNPHTKAFPFWEWLIGDIKAKHPDVIFLSEAFTRPKVMYRLAKLGFSQSYTYFTWRNTKQELTEYFTELTRTNLQEFFRPNLWPNTPDILPEFLQWNGKAGFMMRLVLAAMLGSNYGIYGPAFELCEHVPLAPGKEEYLHSEKYEIRQWQFGGVNDLTDFISRVNRIRHENPALQSDRHLHFHPVDNPELICFSKYDPTTRNRIVTVVNLNPNHKQAGWIDLQLAELQLEDDRPYQMQDLLAGGYYLWHGGRNFVMLDPQVVPAHIFRVRQYVRTEQDFDYFM